MMVQEFVLDKSRFREVRRIIIVRALPMVVLAMVVGVGISYYNQNAQQDQSSFWYVMVPVFLGLLGFGMYRGIQRQKALYNSFHLTIDEQSIVREQANTPTIRLTGSEIMEIIKAQNGSFAVKAGSANRTIIIPAQIENPAVLEKRLAHFGILSSPPEQSLAINALRLLPVATLVLMILVYVTVNKIVVAASGTILLGIMAYSLVVTQRSAHIDGKTKKGAWLLLLVIASVLAVMYAKLSA